MVDTNVEDIIHFEFGIEDTGYANQELTTNFTIPQM